MSLRPPRRSFGSRLPRVLLLSCAFAAVLMFGGVPQPAVAHVDVDVGDGQYVMEIGFRDEPAYLGQPNAVYIHVGRYASGGAEPVDGLAATLSAEITKDGKTLSPPLVPTGDGSYEASFVPTATGDYTFRISGTIGDAAIDESVTSGPSTFNSVEPMTAIEFPAPQPDAATLATATRQARAEAAAARIFGIIGIAVGLLGLIIAIVAITRSGKPGQAPQPAAASATASEPAGKLIR